MGPTVLHSIVTSDLCYPYMCPLISIPLWTHRPHLRASEKEKSQHMFGFGLKLFLPRGHENETVGSV